MTQRELVKEAARELDELRQKAIADKRMKDACHYGRLSAAVTAAGNTLAWTQDRK